MRSAEEIMANNPPYQSSQRPPDAEVDVGVLSDFIWDGFQKSKDLLSVVV
jgi:hypothetical protein